MTLEELINYYKSTEENIIDIGISVDKKGKMYISLIKKDNLMGTITIETYLEEEKCGYIDVRTSFCATNRIYLSQVYCYEKFRGLGIASNMNSLLDYTLKDFPGYVLYGDFVPKQMSLDVEEGKMTKEELLRRALAFYKKARYEVISYNDFISDTSKYPYLNSETDFGGYKANITRVFKQIEANIDCSYQEVDGILVHKNAVKSLKL